ncbi:MAG: ABC transporter permease [Moorella sp. 60_41]|nr:MAG: ABC transporter permease [Moorella sp. 60_41]
MARMDIKRQIQRDFSGWLVFSLLGAALIMLPIFFIVFSLFQEPNENWLHIRQFLLRDYIINTIWLVALSGLLAATLGVILAWLVALYDFPLRHLFRWALVLPLTIPPYIAAYTYSTMLSYTGIVQTTLRNKFAYEINPHILAFSSIKGAVFVFTLFLFPYVYIITRSFLEQQSGSLVESARLLGLRPAAAFARVLLPLARPAIAGGTALVVYEVLGDYGVTSYFGISTVTVAIFQVWFGLYDIDSAMRLAAWLMVSLVGFFGVERVLRHRQGHSFVGRGKPVSLIKLRPIPGAVAFLLCSLVLSLGFIVPLLQLTAWARLTWTDVWKPAFIGLTAQTLYVAALSTALVILLAVVVANTFRRPSALAYLVSRGVTAGYAIPGAVIAVGVLAVFTALDGVLSPLYAWIGLTKDRLVLSTSLVMLIAGYIIRFMAVGYNSVEAGFAKIGTKYVEAARLMGLGIGRSFFKVDLPLLKPHILAGFVATFVEICKELPLTLLLRPFNFETLATKVYQYAHEERIYEASIPSLMIIGVSMFSVVISYFAGREVRQ